MKAEVLSEVVSPAGTGIPDLKAHLIKRQGRVCWYERSDGVHEVFRVKIQKAKKIFEREYPTKKFIPEMKILVKLPGVSPIREKRQNVLTD